MSFASRHCRHYSWREGPRCAKGIDIDRPLGALPCMPPGSVKNAFTPCPEREDYTADERAAQERDHRDSIARTFQCLAVIPSSPRDRSAWGTSGEASCPACKGGTISWSRSRRNGHLQARCSTPKCFQVIV